MNQKSGSVLMSRQCSLSGWAAGQLGKKRLAIWDSSFSRVPMCCCMSALLTRDLHISPFMSSVQGTRLGQTAHATRSCDLAGVGRWYDRQESRARLLCRRGLLSPLIIGCLPALLPHSLQSKLPNSTAQPARRNAQHGQEGPRCNLPHSTVC